MTKFDKPLFSVSINVDVTSISDIQQITKALGALHGVKIVTSDEVETEAEAEEAPAPARRKTKKKKRSKRDEKQPEDAEATSREGIRAKTPWAEAVRLDRPLYITPGKYTLRVEIGDASDETEPPPDVTETRIGSAVSSGGDLNGDDIGDFFTGAPGLTVGDQVEAGALLVYFGSADPQELVDPDIIFEGVSAHDRTGVSVAGGFDFNGDDIPDIAIGAEQVNRTGEDDPVAGWGKDARAETRRAVREGTAVTVDRDGDPAVLDAFHALLSQTAERQDFRIRSRQFLGRLAEPRDVANAVLFLASDEAEFLTGVCLDVDGGKSIS